MWKAAAIAALLVGLGLAGRSKSGARAAGGAPAFQVDPMWPKVPKQWMLGQVAGERRRARSRLDPAASVVAGERRKAEDPAAPCCHRAAGDGVRCGRQLSAGLGRRRRGLRMARRRHAIHVDFKGNVWISSAGGPRLATKKENQILKFTQAGKFLLQIGRRGMSKGSLDTDNFNNAADIFVYAKTNEVFVADGYVNRRVIVLDADTGKFKRMWGAYGNAPDDAAPNQPTDDGPGAAQFNLVHGVRVSDDGLVYVADRRNNRMQVFTVDGKFQRELFVERKTRLLGTSFSVAFSPDPRQEFLYLADAGNGRVHIYDRKTLQEVGGFGRIGHYAGEFVFLHVVAADSKGNLYTAEVGGGRRVQKFLPSRPR
jgi:DNA-binding beta-propeller fold protein YncE